MYLEKHEFEAFLALEILETNIKKEISYNKYFFDFYKENFNYLFGRPETEMFYARQLWLYNLGFHRFSHDPAYIKR